MKTIKYFVGGALIFGGYGMGWDYWKTLFSKKK